jgi:hypothetical protein
MKLKLSLPENRIVWALSNPFGLGYITERREIGVQEEILILSSSDKEPKVIELNDYPKWAQNMILSSIRSGEILNTGDPIGSTEKVDDLPKVEGTTKKVTTKKKQPRRKSNKQATK